MNRVAVVGGALTTVGIAGYILGIVAAYPGRAFSVTAVMVGLALATIGRSNRREAAR